MARTLVIVALAIVGSAAAASAIRYGMIEVPDAAERCEGGGHRWCPLRQWIVILFLNHAFGIGAVAFAAIAVLRPRAILIVPAAAASVIALLLYNADFGALAAVLSIVAVLRQFGATRAA